MTDAQRRASAKYKQTRTRSIRLEFNVDTDADILAKLDAVDNRQGYIKSLIRRDIAAKIDTNADKAI